MWAGSTAIVDQRVIIAHATISGKTVYVSGSIGIDKETGKLRGDIKGQTVCTHGFVGRGQQLIGDLQQAALENMSKVLKSAGTETDNILKVNIFLSNLANDFAPMNEVYGAVRIFTKESLYQD